MDVNDNDVNENVSEEIDLDNNMSNEKGEDNDSGEFELGPDVGVY